MTKAEIGSEKALRNFLDTPGHDWGTALIQGVDLTPPPLEDALLRETRLEGAIFLECQLTPKLAVYALGKGALLFPLRGGLPFSPGRPELYQYTDLLDVYDPVRPPTYRNTMDWKCYLAAMDTATGKKRADLGIDDYIFFRIHDLCIEHALDRYLHPDLSKPETFKRAVGIMGGHNRERAEKDSAGDAPYMTVALLARKLAQLGFTIVTGGGPGAMEAGNLGAWFASYPEEDLRAAVRILATTAKLQKSVGNPPVWNSGEWLAPAYQVIAKFPRNTSDPRTESIGVPTWFYGHEPPNVFASHIAKYFENSLREEGLLAIARKGVIFAEGSAGTIQEIFQNATQNYYQTQGPPAPMVLLGTQTWNPGGTGKLPGPQDKPAWPLLLQLATEKHFENLLLLTDDIEAVIRHINQ